MASGLDALHAAAAVGDDRDAWYWQQLYGNTQTLNTVRWWRQGTLRLRTSVEEVINFAQEATDCHCLLGATEGQRYCLQQNFSLAALPHHQCRQCCRLTARPSPAFCLCRSDGEDCHSQADKAAWLAAKAALDKEAETAASDNDDGLGPSRRDMVLSEGKTRCKDAGDTFLTAKFSCQ